MRRVSSECVGVQAEEESRYGGLLHLGPHDRVEQGVERTKLPRDDGFTVPDCHAGGRGRAPV